MCSVHPFFREREYSCIEGRKALCGWLGQSQIVPSSLAAYAKEGGVNGANGLCWFCQFPARRSRRRRRFLLLLLLSPEGRRRRSHASNALYKLCVPSSWPKDRSGREKMNGENQFCQRNGRTHKILQEFMIQRFNLPSKLALTRRPFCGPDPA